MPDKELLERKLAEIMEQLGYLGALVNLSKKALLGDARDAYFAERVMERLIGAAIDINMHLGSDLSGKVPDDYFSSFILLGSLGVLPPEFAEKLAPSAGLRNLLVHDYQEVNPDKFMRAVQVAHDDYRLYAKHIQAFLNR